MQASTSQDTDSHNLSKILKARSDNGSIPATIFGLASSSSGGGVEELKSASVCVVGVAGGSGSGKTTFSRAIVDIVGEANITYISHDNYYKDCKHMSVEARADIDFDSPNQLDTSLLVEHLKAMKSGSSDPVMIPEYDFASHTRKDQWKEIIPSKIILIEGILIFAEPELVELMDFKLFIDTDDDIRFIRRMKRDIAERGRTVDQVVEQYLKTVRPSFKRFVEPSKRVADLIIPEGLKNGTDSVALQIVSCKLLKMITRI